jgi:hypothetical protein
MDVMVAPTDTGYTNSIAAAVRAELSRQQRKFVDIAAVLHVSRATAYRRIWAQEPFDVAELEKIAGFLGISVDDIFESAEFGRRITSREVA